jgi:hypothetical protein
VDGARGRDTRTDLILATALASARPSPQPGRATVRTPAAPLQVARGDVDYSDGGVHL